MDYFDEIKAISPELTPEELSDRLNEFEMEILAMFPDAYGWEEWAQNALIIAKYKEKYATRNIT